MSISPTFYEQLFLTKVFRAHFLYIQCSVGLYFFSARKLMLIQCWWNWLLISWSVFTSNVLAFFIIYDKIWLVKLTSGELGLHEGHGHHGQRWVGEVDPGNHLQRGMWNTDHQLRSSQWQKVQVQSKPLYVITVNVIIQLMWSLWSSTKLLVNNSGDFNLIS